MKVMNNRKGVIRALLSVTGIVVLSKILGFIKQMVTANYFGATLRTDIISLSQGIVTDLDYIVSQSLITAFIPTYIHLKSKEKEKEKKFVSNTIIVFFVSAGVISILMILIAGMIAKAIAPSYGNEESAELAKYIRIVSPLFAFIVQIAIYNALLKANKVFVPGELTGFNQSVILILLIILIGGYFGPDTLVIGFYVYSFFNLTYLFLRSRQLCSFRWENPFVDPNVVKLFIMMGPLLLGYGMVFINQQVDKIIVSGLGEGTITAMSYAAVLSNFIGTFIGSISGVLFTYVTQSIVDNKNKNAANLINQSSVQLITLLLPVSILTVMNANDIVTLVFGRGKFTDDAVSRCALALTGYGFMFVPYVLRELFSRFQYGYGDSKRPMINSSIAIAFNIILSVLLSRFLGVLGVTLATSISVWISALLNIFDAKKKNCYISVREYMRYLPRWGVGAGICIFVSFSCQKMMMDIHVLPRMSVICIMAFFGYIMATYPVISPLIDRMQMKSGN